jgi:hypothetical protein
MLLGVALPALCALPGKALASGASEVRPSNSGLDLGLSLVFM